MTSPETHSPKRLKRQGEKSMGERKMRGMQLTKDQLEELCWKQELSLDQLEEKLECSRTKVHYWLK